MSFLEHLTELRIRLIRALISLSLAVILCFIFVDKIINVLLACVPDGQVKLVSLYPIEIFMTWIKVSVVAGLFIAFPCIFYEIWMFVAPGLYKRERNFALPLHIGMDMFYSGRFVLLFHCFSLCIAILLPAWREVRWRIPGASVITSLL